MAETLRMATAVLGNAASMSLYVVPMFTFKRIIKKKSTGEYSCLPYVVALMNCLTFIWYGLPIVSNKWENLPLVTLNTVGITLESSYILIYFWYASPKGKAKVAMTAIPVIVAFCIIAIVSTFALHDSHHRKLLVGSIGFVTSAVLYSAPLVAMKKVIQTKSLESMPLSLCLCSFLASVFWLIYGLLIRDIFVGGPSVIGVPLGILQLILQCKYWKRKVTEEPNKQDLEKGDLVKEGIEMADTEKEALEKNMSNDQSKDNF